MPEAFCSSPQAFSFIGCYSYYSASEESLLLLAGFSLVASTLGCMVTPANSGSIMIRPQYSQTITFLRERISNTL